MSPLESLESVVRKAGEEELAAALEQRYLAMTEELAINEMRELGSKLEGLVELFRDVIADREFDEANGKDDRT